MGAWEAHGTSGRTHMRTCGSAASACPHNVQDQQVSMCTCKRALAQRRDASCHARTRSCTPAGAPTSPPSAWEEQSHGPVQAWSSRAGRESMKSWQWPWVWRKLGPRDFLPSTPFCASCAQRSTGYPGGWASGALVRGPCSPGEALVRWCAARAARARHWCAGARPAQPGRGTGALVRGPRSPGEALVRW